MTVERLSRVDKPEAVGMLCTAFADYPVMRAVLWGSGSAYAKRLEALIGWYCESRLAREWPVLGIRRDGAMAAVALISGPEARPMPTELKNTYEDLRRKLGEAAFGRLESYEEMAGRGTPAQPYYYLGMLGVHPRHQGEGHGRRLISAVVELSESDPASTGVCLHTETTENVAYYEWLGFRVVAEGDAVGVQTRTMFREDRRERGEEG